MRKSSMQVRIRHARWEEVTRLIAENRDQCLWFLAPDFQPTNRDSAVRALRYIERYGGKAAFERARELRIWLQQPSSSNSVG
jgi:hypothetical protein